MYTQTWNTAGNVAANNDFLGTTNAQRLTIKTNNNDRIVIDETDKQTFTGKFLFNGINHDMPLFTLSNYHTLHPVVKQGSTIQAITDYDLLNVQTIDVNSISFPSGQPNKKSHFKIAANGNVGINIEKPMASLHVHNGIIRVTGKNFAGGPMMIFGGDYQAQSGDWGIEYAKSTSLPSLSGLNFWKPAGSNNFGNYFLFLADNGNVGVGTDNPGSFKLAVEGKIGAREIKVTMNKPWPDYVFDSDHRLQALEELEMFVKENKHLPGIKSAALIKKDNGIDLGEMLTKHMEKIEEIYLYLIDLKKEVSLLKDENKRLKDDLGIVNKESLKSQKQ
ncbi:hypothetical protein [Chryseobacterium limigenitum]